MQVAGNASGVMLRRPREAPPPQPGPAAAALPPRESCEWRRLATAQRVVSAAPPATAGEGGVQGALMPARVMAACAARKSSPSGRDTTGQLQQ